ncbi:fimbrial biogenesis chaperone [Variovorax saccharolyticus]|uniref:fimbrial biogenesis chaperone n=1 Tax=Variovorax saccharolyticus TaxID=3053516 RepID=UPI00257622F3|nr:fimbria/pilus periplasmic chaperone [Variovorax sp. J22R187]MDM0020134.1 fimbria/pilus periplasmic chaperone [Variovorax sp. J22R187]
MKNHFRKYLRWAVAVSAFGFGFSQAGIVITGTRVVYPAQEREVTIKINNTGTLPALVQSWIDDGNEKTSAQEKSMPFSLLPPVFRVDPGKAQTLRMSYTQEPLPQDRESVFWLNVLEIPPRPDAETRESRNLLQMAFRSRIKIFFRPQGLPGDADAAAAGLRWQLTTNEAGTGYDLEAENPSAFHVSISKASVSFGEQAYEAGSGMVAPRGSQRFPLAGLAAKPAAAPRIRFTAINDYGALVDREAGPEIRGEQQVAPPSEAAPNT